MHLIVTIQNENTSITNERITLKIYDIRMNVLIGKLA